MKATSIPLDNNPLLLPESLPNRVTSRLLKSIAGCLKRAKARRLGAPKHIVFFRSLLAERLYGLKLKS